MLTRPIVRYHGGKWRLAPWIIGDMPAHRVYVEPFGGGASVLLRKARSYAEVYNDLDGEIVNLFRVARDHGAELRSRLELTPFARDECRESYEPSDDAIEQARRTVVRAFMGFGSNAHNRSTGFRSNSNRSGTTPAHDWANYPKALSAIIDRLQGVVIENTDVRALLASHDSDATLFYVDPPYPHSTRCDGMESNYRHELTDAEHLDLLNRLKSIRGMVIVSGYPCDLYDDELAGWARVARSAHADGARERVECLWLSPSCATAMQPSLVEAV